jgi:hypothetical protein
MEYGIPLIIETWTSLPYPLIIETVYMWILLIDPMSESKIGLFLFLANNQDHTSCQEHILGTESPGFR